MKVMVAGTGSFGCEHLSRLKDRPGLVLGAADPNARNLAGAARLCDLAQTDADPFRLIERFRPDALIVASPAASHVPIALAALRAGIPVLVEKPVAGDAASAAKLAAAAGASTGLVLAGHVLRFCPWHQRLVELVRGGAVGRVLAIRSRRFRDAAHATRYRDIDPVLMTMVHDIDLALWIGGKEPIGAEARRLPGNTPRSYTDVRAHCADGVLWQLETGWLHPHSCPPDRIEVLGTNGSIELVAGQRLHLFAARCEKIVLRGDTDPLTRELDWFLAAVDRGETTPPVGIGDAERGLRVAEMFLRALQ